MAESLKSWLVWLMRFTFVGFCFFLAWQVWLRSQGQWFFEAVGGPLLSGGELLQVFGLTVAIFGGFQGLFRWMAVPRLDIRMPLHPGPWAINDPNYAIHHIEIWNREWPWLLRPLFLATAPEGCQVRFRYWKDDAPVPEIFPSIETPWIHGRWDENPEPVTLTRQGAVINWAALVQNRRLAKLFPTEKPGHIDSFQSSVSFAIKRKGDPDFYHFNDESYLQQQGSRFCRQDRKLGPGTYRVDVRITGYGLLAARTATFRLTNSGTNFEDFILEPWTQE